MDARYKEARDKLVSLSPIVIVITGVVGKTVQRDVLISVLSERFTCFASRKDSPALSDHIEDIRKKLSAKDQVYVAEVSLDAQDQYKDLVKLLNPDIVVITETGKNSLPTEEIISFVKESAFLIINADSESARNLSRLSSKTVLISTKENGSLRATDIKADVLGTSFVLNAGYPGISSGRVRISTSLPGFSSVYVSLQAAAASACAGLSLSEIRNGLVNVKYPRGRLNILRGVGGSTIIDDTYDFTTLSAISALDLLKLINGNRKFAVFSGSINCKDGYDIREAGKKAAQVGLDSLILVGDELNPLADAFTVDSMAFGAVPKIQRFESVEAVIYGLVRQPSFRYDDVILIKGAQEDRMERVVEAVLQNRHEAGSQLIKRQ